jgi:hypothetical protein
MFFRVLSAMVVADAIDRRARRAAHRWPAPAASNARHSDHAHDSRAAPRSVAATAGSRGWDRSAPERPC